MGESILMGGGGRIPQLSEQVETFYLTAGVLSFTLIWTQPAQDQDESFIGTRIVRKVGSCPQSPNDGAVIYEGTAFTYTDTGLTEGTTYYYRAFAYNAKRKYQNSMRCVYLTATAGVPISSLPVGSIVKLSHGGNANTPYLLVHQGNPDSTIYDESCNGTWLLRTQLIAEMPFNGTRASTFYVENNIRTYLEDVYYTQFSTQVKNCIRTVKIPYFSSELGRISNLYKYENGYKKTGANGLESNVFLLDGNEVGFQYPGYESYPCNTGSKLDYFPSNTGGDLQKQLRVATYASSGQAGKWWTRTPTCLSNADPAVTVVSDTGTKTATISNGPNLQSNWAGVRPAFIVEPTTLMNPYPDVSGMYSML